MEITGQPDGPPQMMGDNIGDSIPAVWTAYGILLALESRRKTGLGQHVDMAMYDCMVAHSTSSVAVYQVSGRPPRRGGENMVSAQLTLKAKDGYVVLAGAADEQKWVALWGLIGKEELSQDPRFLGRGVAGNFFVNQVQPELEQWSVNLTRWDLTQALLDLGFSAAMVQDAEDMLNCPQLMGRHMWTEVDRPPGGTFTVPSNPVKIPGVGDTQPRRAPLLGEHTEEVLHDLLGLSEVQMSDMRSAGAV